MAVHDNLLQESSSINTFKFQQVEKKHCSGHCHQKQTDTTCSGDGKQACKAKTQNVKQSSTNVTASTNKNSDIVSDIAKARQNIQSKLASSGNGSVQQSLDALNKRISDLESHAKNLTGLLETLIADFKKFTLSQEQGKAGTVASQPSKAAEPKKPAPKPVAGDDDDDDVDLFGSDDEVDKEAEELRQKRLAEYAQKKSKKPAAVAKSSIILDVKPWSDETDLVEMQRLVRTIEMDGLVWGAANLEPLAYGIKKLRIVCVIEDDKVSVEELTEKIEEFADLVQSVDIAAFNKV